MHKLCKRMQHGKPHLTYVNINNKAIINTIHTGNCIVTNRRKLSTNIYRQRTLLCRVVAIYNRNGEANIISLQSPNNHFGALQIIYNYRNNNWKSRKQLYTTRVQHRSSPSFDLTVHICRF